MDPGVGRQAWDQGIRSASRTSWEPRPRLPVRGGFGGSIGLPRPRLPVGTAKREPSSLGPRPSLPQGIGSVDDLWLRYHGAGYAFRWSVRAILPESRDPASPCGRGGASHPPWIGCGRSWSPRLPALAGLSGAIETLFPISWRLLRACPLSRQRQSATHSPSPVRR